MRISALALAAAAFVVGEYACDALGATTPDTPTIVLHSTLDDVGGGVLGIAPPIAGVKEGETFTITGACVPRAVSADGLRVVLTLADRNDTPGYHAVMATDQEMQADGLDVRAPDVPGDESRVFVVRVFRLDNETALGCDAGRIRIDATIPAKLG